MRKSKNIHLHWFKLILLSVDITQLVMVCTCIKLNVQVGQHQISFIRHCAVKCTEVALDRSSHVMDSLISHYIGAMYAVNI